MWKKEVVLVFTKACAKKTLYSIAYMGLQQRSLFISIHNNALRKNNVKLTHS
jgi:hypothetical protein